jgi:hypothetical protein
VEPRTYAWIIPARLAVGERPGGAGRSHSRERRAAELDWWRGQGVGAIVSGLRTRHCLADYVDAGFVVRWHPLKTPEQAERDISALVTDVRGLLEEDPVRGVLVHCDMANEWLAGVDAALRLGLGLTRTPAAALRAAAVDGLPVGSLATSIVGRLMSAAA